MEGETALATKARGVGATLIASPLATRQALVSGLLNEDKTRVYLGGVIEKELKLPVESPLYKVNTLVKNTRNAMRLPSYKRALRHGRCRWFRCPRFPPKFLLNREGRSALFKPCASSPSWGLSTTPGTMDVNKGKEGD